MGASRTQASKSASRSIGGPSISPLIMTPNGQLQTHAIEEALNFAAE